MRLALAACGLALFAAMTPVRASVAIDDPVNVPVTQTISSDQVARAIRTALAHRGWVIDKEKPSFIEATHAKPGSFSVTITLGYTSHEVTIEYLDSEGMGYEQESHSIRGNYNKWMRMLAADINTYVTLLASEPPEPLHAQVVPVVPAVPVEAPSKAAPAVTPALAAGASAKVREGAVVRGRPTLADAGSPAPAGSGITLKSEMRNADGHWWYVTGVVTGWVQDADLAAQ